MVGVFVCDKTAFKLSGATPMLKSASPIFFALIPVSTSIPPSLLPMYIELPELPEKADKILP